MIKIAVLFLIVHLKDAAHRQKILFFIILLLYRWNLTRKEILAMSVTSKQWRHSSCVNNIALPDPDLHVLSWTHKQQGLSKYFIITEMVVIYANDGYFHVPFHELSNRKIKMRIYWLSVFYTKILKNACTKKIKSITEKHYTHFFISTWPSKHINHLILKKAHST